MIYKLNQMYFLFFLVIAYSCNSKKEANYDIIGKNTFLKMLSIIKVEDENHIRDYIVYQNDSDSTILTNNINCIKDLLAISSQKNVVVDSIFLIDSLQLNDNEHSYKYEVNLYNNNLFYLGKVQMYFYDRYPDKVMNIYCQRAVILSDEAQKRSGSLNAEIDKLLKN